MAFKNRIRWDIMSAYREDTVVHIRFHCSNRARIFMNEFLNEEDQCDG